MHWKLQLAHTCEGMQGGWKGQNKKTVFNCRSVTNSGDALVCTEMNLFTVGVKGEKID